MKKWLVLLLLFITTAGTVVPCCLADNCNEEETTQSESKPRQEGVCSPFFACASCSGFTHMTKPVCLAQPVAGNPVHYETLAVIHLSTYASSFWQPPRLS